MSDMAEPSRTHGTQAAPDEHAVPEQAPNEAPKEEAATAKVAELEERVTFLEDQWRRALADLDNVRKQMARDLERARTDERIRMASQWLPVIDNLDRALAHAQAEPTALVEGVRAIRDQAVAILGSLGFPRREARPGERFDPVRHEAVATMPNADAPEGTVLDVVLPGYGDDERQLRPTGVVVATKAE
jgi:molecular chaperone GrpE